MSIIQFSNGSNTVFKIGVEPSGLLGEGMKYREIVGSVEGACADRATTARRRGQMRRQSSSEAERGRLCPPLSNLIPGL